MSDNVDITGTTSPANTKHDNLEENGTLQIVSLPVEEHHDVPYKGLNPYTELDTNIFFGRNQDIQDIVNNLLAWRVTLLYGKSGVGKSSVLRAGVTHTLNEEAQQNIIDYDGVPKLAVVVFPSLNRHFSWRDNPLSSLMQHIEKTIADKHWGIQPPQPGLPFVETLEGWTNALGGEAGNGELYLILDQFEEYFLYPPEEEGKETFLTEFPRAVNCPNLRVNFLISIREDAIASLDRFKNQIPNLFAHRLSIGHLNGEAGKEAIIQPIEHYNQQHGTAIAIEPLLVDMILDEVQVGKVVLGENGIGGIDGKPKQLSEMQIETPYLQLVMERLWREEVVDRKSHLLRLETFKNLGQADQIVKDHLNYQMQLLTEAEQQNAASIFQYLVTASGSKYAYSVQDLFENTGLNKTELKQLLEKLATGDRRIVRPVGVAKLDQPDTQPYEIFHDALAAAILNWRRRYLNQQKLESETVALAEKQRKATERQRKATAKQLAKTRKRWGVALLISGLSTIAIAAILGIKVYQQQQKVNVADLKLRGSQALVQWQTSDQLDTLKQAMQAGQEVKTKNLLQQAPTPMLALQQILDGIREKNHWELPNNLAALNFGRSPDGQWLAIGSIDGRVALWDMRQQKWTRPFPTNGQPIIDIDLSRDGQKIATSSTDGQVRVWSPGGQLINAFQGRKGERGPSPSLSPDGQILAVASATQTQTIDLVDVVTGKLISSFNIAPNQVSTIKFSPDGKRLAIVSRNTIRLMDLKSKLLTTSWKAHNGRISDLSFSPDGQQLATASSDKTARLWDLQGRQLRTLRGHEGAVMSVAFSSDGKQLATGGADGTARVWQLKQVKTPQLDQEEFEPTELLKLTGHNSYVTIVSFSQDGKNLTTVTQVGTVSLWDLRERPTITLNLPSEQKKPMAFPQMIFSSDGQWIAAASPGDVNAYLWDLQGQLRQKFIKPEAFIGCASFWRPKVFFDPNRPNLLATISCDGTADLWNLDGKWVRELFQGQASQWAVGLSHKFDDPLVVTTTTNGIIRIWNSQGKQLTELPDPQSQVVAADFSPDNRKLVIALLGDSSPRIWDRQRGKFQVLKGHQGRVASARFSPDGQLVATASWDGSVRLWNLQGQELLKSRINNRSPVMSVRFDRHGKQLVTASWNGTARIWDLQGNQLAEYRSSTGLWDAGFSPDGQKIVAGGWGGGMIWPVKDLDQLLRDGCSWMKDYISAHPDAQKNLSFCPR